MIFAPANLSHSPEVAIIHHSLNLFVYIYLDIDRTVLVQQSNCSQTLMSMTQPSGKVVSNEDAAQVVYNLGDVDAGVLPASLRDGPPSFTTPGRRALRFPSHSEQG